MTDAKSSAPMPTDANSDASRSRERLREREGERDRRGRVRASEREAGGGLHGRGLRVLAAPRDRREGEAAKQTAEAREEAVSYTHLEPTRRS
eukprot:1720138-Prymnesium_polylepis.1